MICGPGMVPSSIADLIATSTKSALPSTRIAATPDCTAYPTACAAFSAAYPGDGVSRKLPVQRWQCESRIDGITVYALRSIWRAPATDGTFAPAAVTTPSVITSAPGAIGG